MPLPKNINRSHLLAAIKKIDEEGIPPKADSKYYDVIYNKKAYPPKLIVSYANLFANGSLLDRDSFAGGIETECFQLLKKNDFLIIKKDSFAATLLQFLNQAIASDISLKTKDYQKKYNDLQVKVSFGAGNAARIPWIALLKEGQKVSKGIYPVYLYYKHLKLLILAYGVSETKKTDTNWNVTAETVESFLLKNYNAKPERYGSSFVFESYEIDQNKKDFGLDLNKIQEDIIKLISIYNKTILTNSTKNNPTKAYKANIPFDYKKFITDVANAQLSFSNQQVVRFISSLCTKPFVILTGLSGSGKTKLAQSFSRWICETEDQICIVAVGADWTNREPLLGYPNALEKGHYIYPENGVLDLIIRAIKDPNQPYFIILDEMNLSHVEKYFADFLSAMESNEYIYLHPKNSDWELSTLADKIKLPSNLFIIGTVNIDETTYMFSPKVLDRASVIEFSISTSEMSAFLTKNDNQASPLLLNTLGAEMSKDFVLLAKNQLIKIRDNNKSVLITTLISFFQELKKVNAEFGYRNATEAIRFAAVISKIEPTWEIEQIMDTIILQKMLPRVHGSRRKLEPILKTMGALCFTEKQNTESIFISDLDSHKIIYPLSFDKIKRMYQGLIDNGFTSYAEA